MTSKVQRARSSIPGRGGQSAPDHLSAVSSMYLPGHSLSSVPRTLAPIHGCKKGRAWITCPPAVSPTIHFFSEKRP